MALIEIPLLADHHSHPLLYATLQQAIDLSEVFELEEACDRIVQSAQRSSGLTLAYGWKDNRFAFSQRRLEQLPPLAVFNVSLHQLLLNRAGESLLTERYGDAIGQIHDRHWYESHLPTVLNWFANLAGSTDSLISFYQHLETLGVWSAEEMLLAGQQEITWFREAGLLKRTKFWAAPETYQKLMEPEKSYVHGLKLFTDGALGARSAALNKPYQNSGALHENRGMLIYTHDQLQQSLIQASNTGKSIAIHAIGDRAIEQVISSLEGIGTAIENFPEIRIEHAQLIDLPSAHRAKRMGIILSMQPNFNSDSINYADRLPEGYAERNNPFRMLIDQAGYEPGRDLIFGSDGMPHGADYALQQSLHPTIENQRISLAEFLKAYQANSDQLFQVKID